MMEVSPAAKDSRDIVRRAEDLNHNQGEISIQKAQRKVDVRLLQYIDTTVDVPVVKQRREDTTGLRDEVQRNPVGQKVRSANLRTENKKQNVFDSESRSDLSFTVQKDTKVIH